MGNRIHIFGASGSGTTSLGREVADRLNIMFLDTDYYYWQKTDPPFSKSHPPAERLANICQRVVDEENWVLSGSICNWAGSLPDTFSLAVFLYLSASERMERLSKRERYRFGDRILAGSDMYGHHEGFMSWARSYDTASSPIRSLDMHEKWIRQLPCRTLRLDGGNAVQALVESVLSELS